MIFVQAAGGALGRRVVENLIAQGVAPEAIAGGGRSPEKLADLAEKGVAVRRADYTDPEGMAAAFRGVDTLVLIPTKSEVLARIREYAGALDAARTAGVKRVILLSIASAVPESLSVIAPFYLFAESATRLSGMDWLVLRMNLYAEPLAGWAPELAEQGRLPYPVNHGRVAYVTREDIARATAAAAADPDLKGEVLELSGAESLSMPEVAEALSAATGRPIRFEAVSDQEFLDICAVDDETTPFIARVLVSLYHAVDAGEFGRAAGAIERLTGRPPERLGDFLKRVLG